MRIALPSGERLIALDALAARLSTANVTLRPMNGASLDARHRFVRLAPTARNASVRLTLADDTVAYMVDEALIFRFGPAQDPRAFWFDGHAVVLYSREMSSPETFRDQLRGWSTTICIGLRNMSAPTREVILRAPPRTSPFSRRYKWEKNWIPFHHEGQVLLSYRLHPHIVLRCDWSSGACLKVHSTDSPHVWAHHNSSLKMSARGSSPAVRLHHTNSYLGIAHFRNLNSVYDHCFYQFNATPPFAMLGTSARFSFAPARNRSRPNIAQFVAGPCIDAGTQRSTRNHPPLSSNPTPNPQCVVAGMYQRGEHLIISYGAGDSYSLETSIPISTALSLVQSGSAMQRGLVDPATLSTSITVDQRIRKAAAGARIRKAAAGANLTAASTAAASTAAASTAAASALLPPAHRRQHPPQRTASRAAATISATVPTTVPTARAADVSSSALALLAALALALAALAAAAQSARRCRSVIILLNPCLS